MSSDVLMPPDANIPYEWQIASEADRILMVVPSWSRKDKLSYLVIIDKETRKMSCECKGFQFTGDCHHIRGAKWFCSQPNFRRGGSQKTSLEAYFAFTNEMLGERQRIVLRAIQELGPVSDKQIAFVLGWPINTVTPRRGELVDMGLVVSSGDQMDLKTNRRELVWNPVE